MSWVTIAAAIFNIIHLSLKAIFEAKEDRRKQAKELRDEFKEALSERDYSKITILFNRANRLR